MERYDFLRAIVKGRLISMVLRQSAGDSGLRAAPVRRGRAGGLAWRDVRDRQIVGFLRDDQDEWIAELSCGHRRHVRHRPPFELHPWVLDDASRASRLRSWIECASCEDEPGGGEVVCYAALVCPECGDVLDDTHRPH